MSSVYVEFKILHNPNEISYFKDTWRILEKGPDMTCYQTYEWNRLLVERWFSLPYNKLFASLVIFSLKRNNDIVLIAPLYIQKKTVKLRWMGRKSGVYILGTESYSDYLNLIYASLQENDFEVLFHKIKELYPTLDVYFNRIREDTEIYRIFSRRGFEPYHKSMSVYVNISDSSSEYYKQISKNTKQNLRTARNRIEKTGLKYSIKQINGRIDADTAKALDTLHRKRVLNKNNHSTHNIMLKLSRRLMTHVMFQKDNTFNIVLESMMRIESSFTLIVNINDDIAGYLYGIVDKYTIRIIHNCLNEEYAFFSPVFLAAFDFIVEQCDKKTNRIQTVDFTRGEEQYKYRLGGQATGLYSFRLY